MCVYKYIYTYTYVIIDNLYSVFLTIGKSVSEIMLFLSFFDLRLNTNIFHKHIKPIFNM